MALCIADALRKSARRFPDSLPVSLSQAAEAAAHRQGEFFVSATELCLALELYLKALIISSGKQTPRTHDLAELFETLSPADQAETDALYRRLCAKATPGETVGYVIRIQLKDDASTMPPDVSSTNVLPSSSEQTEGLLEVLRRTGSAFSTWRYMYESGRSGEAREFDYEHGLLQLACEALRRSAYPRFTSTLAASVKAYLDTGVLPASDESLGRFLTP